MVQHPILASQTSYESYARRPTSGALCGVTLLPPAERRDYRRRQNGDSQGCEDSRHCMCLISSITLVTRNADLLKKKKDQSTMINLRPANSAPKPNLFRLQSMESWPFQLSWYGSCQMSFGHRPKLVKVSLTGQQTSKRYIYIYS